MVRIHYLIAPSHKSLIGKRRGGGERIKATFNLKIVEFSLFSGQTKYAASQTEKKGGGGTHKITLL